MDISPFKKGNFPPEYPSKGRKMSFLAFLFSSLIFLSLQKSSQTRCEKYICCWTWERDWEPHKKKNYYSLSLIYTLRSVQKIKIGKDPYTLGCALPHEPTNASFVIEIMMDLNKKNCKAFKWQGKSKKNYYPYVSNCMQESR